MDDEAIKKMIRRHEGYRERIYADSVGVLTIGYGHALHENSKMSPHMIDLLFEQDFNNVLTDYKTLTDNNGISLDPVRRAVLIDMLFNLGILKLSKFKKMIAAIKAQNYMEAARQMLKSKWSKQVGPRSTRLARMMETGSVKYI